VLLALLLWVALLALRENFDCLSLHIVLSHKLHCQHLPCQHRICSAVHQTTILSLPFRHNQGKERACVPYPFSNQDPAIKIKPFRDIPMC
jgi:hypothetical protein